MGVGDARFKNDVAAKVETIGHVIGVFQQFRLSAVFFLPIPFLLQVLIEGVGVFHAFQVTARAGITIPIPGPANAIAALIYTHAQPHAA